MCVCCGVGRAREMGEGRVGLCVVVHIFPKCFSFGLVLLCFISFIFKVSCGLWLRKSGMEVEGSHLRLLPPLATCPR